MKESKTLKRGKHIDKLIAAVKAREILWDRDYRGHRNRYKLERHWSEVALELGSSSDKCRKQWKNLKDQCRKELKKNINVSDWPHFDKLEFIHHLFIIDEDGDEGNETNEETHIPEDESKRPRLSFTMRKKIFQTKKRSLQMDTNKLIDLVREREIIWNRQHKRHHHWQRLDTCWKEIAEILNVSHDEARIKWKYIRDTARKECRKPDSEWIHLPKLQFLTNQFNEFTDAAEEEYSQEDYLEDDPVYLLVENEIKEDEFDEFETKPVIHETDFADDDNMEQDTISVSPKTSIPTPVLEREVVDSTKDEDVGFFNSLLPHVRKLNPANKMMLRIKMQEMVYNIVYNKSS